MSEPYPAAHQHRERAAPLSDDEIVAGFRAEQISGRAVMGRLLGKLGVSPQYHRYYLEKPLQRMDGSAYTDQTGAAVTFGSYLDTAHEVAAQSILDFVQLDQSHPVFDQQQQALNALVTHYLGGEQLYTE
jgi:hypothetical protein